MPRQGVNNFVAPIADVVDLQLSAERKNITYYLSELRNSRNYNLN